MELFKSKKFSRKKLIQTIIEKLHHQNDFRVTPIFKIIIRICQTNAEVCRKTSKFLLKRCLFIFCIFYLNEEELIKQVQMLPLTKQKKAAEEERKYNSTWSLRR